jgi:hypothetical protein
MRRTALQSPAPPQRGPLSTTAALVALDIPAHYVAMMKRKRRKKWG